MFDDQVVLDEIRVLLVQKRAAPEPGLAPTVPVLNAFIEAELRDVPMNIPDKPQSAKVIARLNTLFHDALLEHESKGLE